MAKNKVGDVVVLTHPFETKLEYIIGNIDGIRCTLIPRKVTNYSDCIVINDFPIKFIEIVNLEEKAKNERAELARTAAILRGL